MDIHKTRIDIVNVLQALSELKKAASVLGVNDDDISLGQLRKLFTDLALECTRQETQRFNREIKDFMYNTESKRFDYMPRVM